MRMLQKPNLLSPLGIFWVKMTYVPNYPIIYPIISSIHFLLFNFPFNNFDTFFINSLNGFTGSLWWELMILNLEWVLCIPVLQFNTTNIAILVTFESFPRPAMIKAISLYWVSRRYSFNVMYLVLILLLSRLMLPPSLLIIISNQRLDSSPLPSSFSIIKLLPLFYFILIIYNWLPVIQSKLLPLLHPKTQKRLFKSVKKKTHTHQHPQLPSTVLSQKPI